MDVVHTEARSVLSRAMGQVITELIFLLVAPDGKAGNRSHKLIVAKSFEARNGAESRTEGECQGEAEVRIAFFRVMQVTGVESERTHPIGAEVVLIAQQKVEVIRERGGSGGRQCSLLDEIVVDGVIVSGRAQEPL